MFNIRYKYILLIACMLAGSCKKFVDVDLPIDTLPGESAFATDEKASSVVRGLYHNMVRTTNYAMGGAVSAGLGASADELIVTSPTSAYYELFINQINTSNTVITGYYWGAFYNTIYVANNVLERVPASAGITDARKSQLLAEAHFVRAVNYFYLVNLYGDVPLVTGTDYRVNTRIARAPIAKVYELIMSDLQFAYDNLGANYQGTQRIRANKFAAAAMLARVYLYQKDYINAARMATEVIDGKDAAGATLYRLETMLNNVFLINSREVILHLMTPGQNLYTWDGYAFVPGNATSAPGYQVTPELLGAFATDDQRRTDWVRTVTITTAGVTRTYLHPYKYKVNGGSGAGRTEALAFLRLAEMYLIRAEARAQNNDPLAIADLDAVRNRAGLTTPTDPTITKPNLLAAIAHENRIEFFAELGHRWLDLKRKDEANTVLKDKPNWNSDMQLYPIPFTEIRTNTLLGQNDGYNF